MKRSLRTLLILCLVLALSVVLVGCSNDAQKAANDAEGEEHHDDHDHEEHHHHDICYEWSGIFEFEEGKYTMKFNKNDGDDSILVAFISADSGIKDIEHHAIHVMEAEAKEVEKDGSFVAENEYTYKLELNGEPAEFEFELEKPGRYYVFTEHMPEEFDMQILNADGEEIKAENPKVYEDHDHDHE